MADAADASVIDAYRMVMRTEAKIDKAPDNAAVSRADARRTLRVHKLYERLFHEPWPAGWQVLWHVYGLTVPEWRTTLLSCESMSDPMDLETVVHELLHVRRPEMRHGKAFSKEVRRLMKELKK